MSGEGHEGELNLWPDNNANLRCEHDLWLRLLSVSNIQWQREWTQCILFSHNSLMTLTVHPGGCSLQSH